MPNWCSNNVRLSHEDPAMITRVKNAFEREELFGEFITNPNPENWYDFNCTHFGTKWDVGDKGFLSKEELNTESTEVQLCFGSAWSPPIEGYMALEELGFFIDAYYYEPGMNYCGHFREGYDEYYEITGDSEWVTENIPEDIIEEFDIVESMQMWEED